MEKMSIRAGKYSFSLYEGKEGWGFSVCKEDPIPLCLCKTEAPLRLTIRLLSGFNRWYTAPYSEVEQRGNLLLGKGKIETESGSVYGFEDTVSPREDGASFLFQRKVTVEKATDDQGFFSRISFVMQTHTEPGNFDFFGPGAWYQQNKKAPEFFMGYDLSLDYHWYNETRFALPFLSMQDRFTGDILALCRPKADVKPWDGSQPSRVYHSSPEYSVGSLGFGRPGGLSLDYVYPGTEAGSPRMFSPRAGGKSLMELLFPSPEIIRQMHPSEEGFTQEYGVIVLPARKPDFQSMMRDTWRYFDAVFHFPVAKVDNKELLKAVVDFLDPFCRSWTEGEWGFPGAWDLPGGEITDVMHQFGFVGQQPGMGHMFIRYGKRFGRPDLVQKGKNVIDFWVNSSMMEIGLPNVWFVLEPPRFRMEHPIWIRMLSDGMENIIDAYAYLKKQGEEQSSWLRFCTQTAEWLVKHQNEDGSWYRAYNTDETVFDFTKGMTVSAIRFLVQLHLVTGDKRYKETALRAGVFSYKNVYKKMEYVGGTCDNGGVLDKEAGIYAMFGFLALYDLTGEAKWLEAARGAADYTETWTMKWSYPVYVTIHPHSFETRDLTGQSFIATGHSAMDMYMAACSYTYYRLYLLTGEKHYLEFARFCHKNPRQHTDVDGSIGYRYRGMTHEATQCYTQVQWRADSNVLFTSYTQIEPILRMLDTFDAYEIEEAEALPTEEKLLRNRIYDGYGKAR